MSRAVKIWLIIAASLILAGGLIFVGVMTVNGWNFAALSTYEYETNEYEITEEFTSISLKSYTSDIKLLPAEAERAKVVCREETKLKHSVTVEDGMLSVEHVDSRKWYEHIGINFNFEEGSEITVYLPENEYDALSVSTDTGDVEISKSFNFNSVDISTSTGEVENYASASGKIRIKTSTGDIDVEDISCGTLELIVTTGDIDASNISCEGECSVSVSTGSSELDDLECNSFVSSGSSGDISLAGVIVSEKLSINRSTGDISFNGCDASEIYITTDTGDVRGSLLSQKVFIANTDTGKVSVPNSIEGGRCEISTDTGDIILTVK